MIELLLFFLIAMLIALWLAQPPVERSVDEWVAVQQPIGPGFSLNVDTMEVEWIVGSIVPRRTWAEYDDGRYLAGDPQRKRVAVPFESEDDKPSPGWRPPGWVPNTAGVYEVACTLPGIWYSAYDPERELWGLAQPNVESARWALEKIGPSKSQHRIWRGRHRPRNKSWIHPMAAQ